MLGRNGTNSLSSVTGEYGFNRWVCSHRKVSDLRLVVKDEIRRSLSLVVPSLLVDSDSSNVPRPLIERK